MLALKSAARVSVEGRRTLTTEAAGKPNLFTRARAWARANPVFAGLIAFGVAAELVSETVFTKRMYEKEKERQAEWETIEVLAPPGAKPGDMVPVENPHQPDTAFHAPVPKWCSPGQSFKVSIPKVPPPLPEN